MEKKLNKLLPAPLVIDSFNNKIIKKKIKKIKKIKKKKEIIKERSLSQEKLNSENNEIMVTILNIPDEIKKKKITFTPNKRIEFLDLINHNMSDFKKRSQSVNNNNNNSKNKNSILDVNIISSKPVPIEQIPESISLNNINSSKISLNLSEENLMTILSIPNELNSTPKKKNDSKSIKSVPKKRNSFNKDNTPPLKDSNLEKIEINSPLSNYCNLLKGLTPIKKNLYVVSPAKPFPLKTNTNTINFNEVTNEFITKEYLEKVTNKKLFKRKFKKKANNNLIYESNLNWNEFQINLMSEPDDLLIEKKATTNYKFSKLLKNI